MKYSIERWGTVTLAGILHYHFITTNKKQGLAEKLSTSPELFVLLVPEVGLEPTRGITLTGF